MRLLIQWEPFRIFISAIKYYFVPKELATKSYPNICRWGHWKVCHYWLAFGRCIGVNVSEPMNFSSTEIPPVCLAMLAMLAMLMHGFGNRGLPVPAVQHADRGWYLGNVFEALSPRRRGRLPTYLPCLLMFATYVTVVADSVFL